MITLLLLTTLALADDYTDLFDADLGRWEGGRVEGGALVVDDDVATLNLGAMSSFEATFRLTKTDAGALTVKAGEARWKADYVEDGWISLGEAGLPFPQGHRELVPDASPVIEPGDDYWDGANTLHCEVYFDAASATWFLYWTGEMGSGYPYRQIGVATSTDGETWTKYAGNPVLTIDYDRTTVDGIHVHMPTVAVDEDRIWHMYYACYQNDVGNRICHATSPDGLSWTPQGVVLDKGGAGEFDEGSLRMPDVLVDDAGAWHMLYNGTDPDQHYGPTGYATSADGWTWEKHGAITDDETRLQGGGMVQTAYGVEQWWNCDDVFCYSVADPADLTTWEDWPEVVLEKGWADWSSGYIQAPSVWLSDYTYHLWFNAYDYAVDDEVIAHAKTVPLPGQTFTLSLSWDGATLKASMDGGPELETPLSAADGLSIVSTGATALDEVSVSYALVPTETGETGETGEAPHETGETGTPDSPDDGQPPADTGEEKSGGCGCASAPGGGWLGVLGLALLARRRRSPAR